MADCDTQVVASTSCWAVNYGLSLEFFVKTRFKLARGGEGQERVSIQIKKSRGWGKRGKRK